MLRLKNPQDTALCVRSISRFLIFVLDSSRAVRPADPPFLSPWLMELRASSRRDDCQLCCCGGFVLACCPQVHFRPAHRGRLQGGLATVSQPPHTQHQEIGSQNNNYNSHNHSQKRLYVLWKACSRTHPRSMYFQGNFLLRCTGIMLFRTDAGTRRFSSAECSPSDDPSCAARGYRRQRRSFERLLAHAKRQRRSVSRHEECGRLFFFLKPLAPL